MDPLADVLALAQVRGTVAATVHAGEAWGLDIVDVPGAAFHAITTGTAWLRLTGRAPIHLMPGDVVLLPTGAGHAIASDPDQQLEPFDHAAAARAMATGGRLLVGAGPVHTRILCASYRHDPTVMAPLLGLLPSLVHLRPGTDGEPVDSLVRLLGREITTPRPGATVVLDRLLDVVLVHIVRAWLDTADADHMPASWLRALRDPVTAAALAALHADPARAWTLDTLARAAATSRATLARRFPDLVGHTPHGYLTRWRMDLAAHRLRTSTEAIGPIARSVGYSSEYAFNRAFARTTGLTPGRYRTQHHTTTRTTN
ncbi:AraC family transcriptional regulator [Actinophytocola sp.]|uniref:AraC family transcriptional regulator n=1 Tax=Actinophytocola sp. TaxID=1872138 RepID=UPI002D8083DC|nr:AraC family transcriptional regulator [Actinophytocola sp.]HET9143108.1 AraC family transcriptional regulator [Actinophytocola sp.]